MCAPFVALALAALPVDVRVTTTDELRRSLAEARPGTRLLVAAGEYGPVHVERIVGAEGAPIVLRGEDPSDPPTLKGGLHVAGAEWFELAHFVFDLAGENGVNVDDAGELARPARHVFLHDLRVRGADVPGNVDGIKLSGLVDFRVSRCIVEAWGQSGSAIDLVGCRDGSIEECAILGPEQEPRASGVQVKGGSRDVRLVRCRFVHAGQRAVNLGGSTGRAYFRPEPRDFEARDVAVLGCSFEGSLAPIAFVGVDGASVRWNTFARPRKWCARILQESREPGFVPCRFGVFADNRVVYRAGEMSVPVNVGPDTASETFVFARNDWVCEDEPGRAPPRLSGVRGDRVGSDDVERAEVQVRGAEALPAEAQHSLFVPFVETRELATRVGEASECRRARDSADGLVLEPDGSRAAEEACFVSAVIAPARPFRDLLASWNLTAPTDAGFQVEVRVARAQGEWSTWLRVDAYGRTPNLDTPIECPDGRIDTDYFRADHELERAQFRVRAFGAGVALVLARFTACFSNPSLRVPSLARASSSVPFRLDVRPRSQHSEAAQIAGRICSPTALAMVLEYRGVAHETALVAARAFDAAHDLHGNWPRNVQAAWTFGVPGFLTRFSSLEEAEERIRSGTPIVASIGVRAGELRGAPYARTAGHLIVITGFDGAGGVFVNDPAVADPAQAAVVYAREDLEAVWLARGGTAYVLLARP